MAKRSLSEGMQWQLGAAQVVTTAALIGWFVLRQVTDIHTMLDWVVWIAIHAIGVLLISPALVVTSIAVDALGIKGSVWSWAPMALAVFLQSLVVLNPIRWWVDDHLGWKERDRRLLATIVGYVAAMILAVFYLAARS